MKRGVDPRSFIITSHTGSNTLDAARLFEWLGDAYLVLDEDAVVVFSNRAFRTLFGLKEHDLDGTRAGTLGRVGDAGRMRPWADWLSAALGTIPPGGTVVSPELPVEIVSVPGAQPRERHFTLHLARTRLGPAGQWCYVVRAEDVTQRVLAQAEDARIKAMLRSKAQLRQVKIVETEERLDLTRGQLDEALSFAKIGTWELDFETGLITCSDQCKFNMGVDVDTVISEASLLNEIVDPEDRDRVRRHIESVVAHNVPYLAEYRVTTVPGRWILAGGRVLVNAERQPVGMAGFTLDITDRKQRELEQSALVITERHGRELSERQVQALDHFIASVSHELRTPIGVILNWAQLLELGGEQFKVSNVVPVLKRNARHLGLMVEDLLDSGAIVSGNLTIRKSRLRLDVVINEICSDLQGDAAQKQLDLRFDNLPEIFVEADEARLRQIFWNLLTNAIKFSETGAISIDVCAAHGFVECRITDNGMGLDADNLEVIFERFKQIDSHHTSVRKGLGLGLWLVRNLVEQHGGSISAESRGAGTGSTFIVRLPLA
ncbi:MAG: ATP-binding protein [Burkholderia gladioli]